MLRWIEVGDCAARLIPMMCAAARRGEKSFEERYAAGKAPVVYAVGTRVAYQCMVVVSAGQAR